MKKLLLLFLCITTITASAQDPAMVWETGTYLDGSSVNVNRFRKDQSGNMYSVGYVTGDVSGDRDLYISKNDANGNVIFSDIYDSGQGNDAAIDVFIDNSGNIYVVGNIRGGVSLFARKYSSTGTVLYTNTYWGAIVSSEVQDADLRKSTGDLYITGISTNDVSGEDENLLLIKYLSDGTVDWIVDYDGGDNNGDFGYQIELDGSGNAYVLGEQNNLTTGTPFLRKYTSAGAYVWARVPSSDGSESHTSMTIESATNVAVYDWNRKQRYATSNGALNETVYFDNTFHLLSKVTYKRLSDGGYIRVGTNTIKRYDSGGNELISIFSQAPFYTAITSGDDKVYLLPIPGATGTIRRYSINEVTILQDWSYTYATGNSRADFRFTENNTLTISSGNDSLDLHRICLPPDVQVTPDNNFPGTPLCSGDTLFLSVNAEYADAYSWFGNGFGPNADTIFIGLPVIQNSTVNLSVEIDAGNGCIVSEDFSSFLNFQTVEAYIVSNFEGDCESDPGVLYSLIDPNYYEYNWYFNDVQQTFNASSDTMLLTPGNGTYTMEILDTQTGCLSIPSPTYEVTGIQPSDDPSFSFAQAQYCRSDIYPSALITGLAGGTFSSSPAGLALNPNNGLIDFSTTTPNSYSIQYVTNGNCPDSSTVLVQISEFDNADFSYSTNTFCLTAINPLATVTGLVGGTFSATGGLVINASTGEIDLSASGIGDYDVTYLTNGTCPSSTMVNVTISTAHEADHTYVGGPFCQGDGTVLPTFGGNANAGAFSATPGGLSIDAVTGEIDFSNSTAGITFTVSNFIAASGGCSAVTETSQVFIIAEDDASFGYASSTFCLTGSNPTITSIGTLGGTFTGSSGLVFNGALGQINLAASGVDSYQITYTTNGNCPDMSVVNVTITTAPEADHSYVGTPFCQSNGLVLPTFSGNASAGAFSATPAGLTIDPVTGEIDPTSSTPGVNYTVSNLIAASGGCAQVTENSTVFIIAEDDPSFEYSGGTFCLTGLDPSPTVNGTSGGTFSGSSGLVINSVSGEIDLTASGVGPYQVAYTTNGNCPDFSVVNVNITTAPEADHSYVGIPYCQGDGSVLPTFSGNASAGAFSATPAGLSIDPVTGELDLASSTAGVVYTVSNFIAASGGCSAVTETSQVFIYAEDDASFAYASSTFCLTGFNPQVVSGTPGGTFSGSTGLVIHPVTGQIDLTASGVGPYQVTYTTNGNCPNISVVNVNITTAPSAEHSYPNSPFCQNEGTATVSFGTGASAGVFSAIPSGLSIDSNTGEVDLAA
ncbi:MAG: hypothetical protein JKX84_08365, partial [Flavobacteriales bacterium]|nr:hypothetical protein [Flavobacteriales bacterium]